MEKYRAPLCRILPSCVPIALEKGCRGYAADPRLAPGERRLTDFELRPVLIAATYLGAMIYASTEYSFPEEEIKEKFDSTFHAIADVTIVERCIARDLIAAFENYKIIRGHGRLDDWIAESWWEQFQSAPYTYPSGLAGAVAYGLSVMGILQRCTLEA
jgi:hypothetical protein